MQIVTDSGTDVGLEAQECQELGVHIVPLQVTLDGRSYQEGIDITPEDLYRQLAESGSLPATSQPAPGVFAALYRRLASVDRDILSVHMSSGLSGTVNAALNGAAMVPEAHVTVVDTKTLSAAAGWQVEAAARAARAGWSLEAILDLLHRIGEASSTFFTLNDLRYLIHGGRISHIKGLLAQLLNIKPVIGVDKVRGIYEQRGQARTFQGALRALVQLVADEYAEGNALRVQVVHALNPEGARQLHEAIASRLSAEFLPDAVLSVVLGAHTGPTMVGAASVPLAVWAAVP